MFFCRLVPNLLPRSLGTPQKMAAPRQPRQTKKDAKWVHSGCQKYNREEVESEVASAAVSSSEERKQKARVSRFADPSGASFSASTGGTAAAPARQLTPRRGRSTASSPSAPAAGDLADARATAERDILERTRLRTAEDLVVTKRCVCLFCLLFCVIN